MVTRRYRDCAAKPSRASSRASRQAELHRSRSHPSNVRMKAPDALSESASLLKRLPIAIILSMGQRFQFDALRGLVAWIFDLDCAVRKALKTRRVLLSPMPMAPYRPVALGPAVLASSTISEIPSKRSHIVITMGWRLYTIWLDVSF
jgi:hypothetical protein